MYVGMEFTLRRCNDLQCLANETTLELVQAKIYDITWG